MSVAYIDTSVLVAIAFAEPDSDSLLDHVYSMAQLYASTLLETEFLATAKREGVPLADAKKFLRPIHWVHPGRRLSAELQTLLWQGYLRGADLHHLATALFLFPKSVRSEVTFMTLDRRQATMAKGSTFTLLPELFGV